MTDADSMVNHPQLEDNQVDDINLATTLCEPCPFYTNQICDYEVLSPDEIVQYVDEFVREINGFVELDTTTTRMLLCHCKWDKDVMMERFFENPEKLYKEAHVIISASAAIQSDHKECEICYEELLPIMSAESACGHKFCKSCWSEYLKVKIMDEGVGNSLECPANDCQVIINDKSVIELVGDEEAKLRYQHLITNSFVQQNKLMRWCPARGCSFAIKADYAAVKPICCYCKCGHEFCFGCAKEYHSPVPCDVLERFETQERLGYFRVRLNTVEQVRQPISIDTKIIKKCPNPSCKIKLQKIGGCHAVKCKICDAIFCWDCLNRYKTMIEVYHHNCHAHENNVDKEPVEKMAAVTPNVPMTSTQSLANTSQGDDRNNVDEEPVRVVTTPDLPMTSIQSLANIYQGYDRNNVDQKPVRVVTTVTPNVLMTSSQSLANTYQGDDRNNVDQKPVREITTVTPDLPMTSTQSLANTSQGDDRNNIDEEPVRVVTTVTPVLMTSIQSLANIYQGDDRNNVDQKPVREITKVTPGVSMTSIQSLANTPQGYDRNNVDLKPVRLLTIVKPDLPMYGIYQEPILESHLRIRPWKRRATGIVSNGGLSPAYGKYNLMVQNLRSALKQFAANRKWLEKCSEKDRTVLAEFELASMELIRTYRTLKYSAIFDIYTKDVTELPLLHNFVKDLEKAVTDLSLSIFGSSLSNSSYENITKLVLPAYTNCQRRRRAMVDFVNEGFDNEWWTFETEPL